MSVHEARKVAVAYQGLRTIFNGVENDGEVNLFLKETTEILRRQEGSTWFKRLPSDENGKKTEAMRQEAVEMAEAIIRSLTGKREY